MLLRAEPDYLIDGKLSGLTIANFPAQTISVNLPRYKNLAYDFIVPVLTFTMKSAVTSGLKGYSYLNLLKKVTVDNIPNASGKITKAVSCGGVSLLQLMSQEGLPLDRSTLGALYAHQHSNWPINGVFRVAYPICCAPKPLSDGLRPRTLLPAFTYTQDPILQMDFSAATDMSGTADPFTAVTLEVFFIRRALDAAAIGSINATGGFIPWDIVESVYNPAASLAGVPGRFAINTQGSYWSIMCSMLAGGATLIPADLSTDSDTIWQLQVAKKDVFANTKSKFMQILNDYSRPQVQPAYALSDGAAYVQATSANAVAAMANWGGALTAGLDIQNPSTFAFEFAGEVDNDVRDLSSMFPTDDYANQGTLFELVADRLTTSATTTLPNYLNIVGRRFFGNLGTFQLL